jgi:hypothetical protein
MNPRDFHVLAIHLAAGNSAAEHRTAVGRSYYAVFNVAADLLRSILVRISRGPAAHGEVQKCLANCGNPEVARVAGEMGNLHSWQNRADYQLDKLDVESAMNATEAADLAGQLIKAPDRVFASPARVPIQTAVAAWRRANGYP